VPNGGYVLGPSYLLSDVFKPAHRHVRAHRNAQYIILKFNLLLQKALLNLSCWIYVASNNEPSCLIWQVKNIAMEILDFYESHRLITDDRVAAAFNKLKP
jgi:hypothetical protein